MSLRARLLITTVVLVAIGLTAADVATHRYLSSFLLKRGDEQLVAARDPAASALSLGGGFDPDHRGSGTLLPPGTYAEVRDSSGQTIGDPKVFGYEQPLPPGPDLPAGLPGSSASTERTRLF